jgi:hypothetical protein
MLAWKKSVTSTVTLFVFATTTAVAGIVTPEFRDRSSVGFRRSMGMLIVIMVTIRAMHMRFCYFDFFGAGHRLLLG